MTGVESGKSRNLAAAIYLWCGLVLAAFAMSGVLILTMACVIADAAHLEDERSLILHDVEQQIMMLARDQAQISHWDEAVLALTGQIDRDFVETEIAGWLWEDFGIDTSVVVAPDDSPVVMVRRDQVLAPSEAGAVIADTADLIEAARQIYLARRTKRQDGYVVAGNPLEGSDPIYIADVRPVAGRMMFVIAQAIIPDRDARLADGPPLVLTTLKPAAVNLLADLNGHDDHGGLAIVGAGEIPEHMAWIPVGIEGDAHEAFAVWEMSYPSDIILARSIAPLMGLLIIAAAALLLVARRSSAALTALQQSEQNNRFMALHDALTELPNRVHLDQALERIIAGGGPDRCAILCLDLDRFKTVNDTYGHHAGDVVIKVIAQRIQRIVGDAGMAARLGGDEFIVLLHDALDHHSVLTRCEQLIASVCRPVAFEGGLADVGASIGVAWWPDNGLTANAVIRSADEALYLAKKQGGARVCFAASAAPHENAKTTSPVAA
ncbi:diguanylate cyclase [uncultured Hoeflea sp.]|uniref:diguanylate cyclase domain-containing protein n=1 Tax=uncultured Hoeflea sp. TaxID=538666 RepID=UPI00261060F3|nr:diguanylate cyclase [uncultured Hoeflea sp.]